MITRFEGEGTGRVWPRPLSRGDTVAVVAPSGPVDPELLRHGISLLENLGFEVRCGSRVLSRHQDLTFLAGTDTDRAADFTQSWTDPEVAAVWAARGGYGAQRMVDLIDFDALRQAGPKHLIGYSDITALHARIGRELGQVTLHGPVAATSAQLDDPQTVGQLGTLLFAPPQPGYELCQGQTLSPGVAVGRLIGGNLSLLAADIGIEPAPAGARIVVLEEVSEEPYRVDRMITQLLRAGWFRGVVGVVIGTFSDSGDSVQVAAVLRDRLGDLQLPMIETAEVGHSLPNRTLPLGATVRLDAGEGTVRLA
ncbi:LD-carboxypeptidase [Microlunatus panaciterrae]|uniref:Muramoyltetrapeptide carboxypeptidase n=1 Tax=Microlunatus panaciterrae TaxID=400768 RepID=A0ABS2RGS6_9ACTN|nr:LD-carboxypeptidase [Microlunatus panaciterrae]MBM7798215.1 muramoyltetrapeptide carboxypeptidase [Microlunatus panaciterrae]